MKNGEFLSRSTIKANFLSVSSYTLEPFWSQNSITNTTYTVLHIFAQVLFWTGNQGLTHTCLLFHKCWLILIEMKQKNSLKKSKWPTQRSLIFQL